MQNRKNEKHTQKLELQQYTLIIALFVLIVAFQLLSKGKVLTPMNINNLIMQNSYIVILAIGMLQCILLGGINLAVGSAVALTGGVGAILIMNYQWPVWAAIIVIIALGCLIGCFEGFFIAQVGIPAFIVTLADMLILRGLILVMLKAQTIGPLPPALTALGVSHIPAVMVPVPGGNLDMITITAAVLTAVVIVMLDVIKCRKNQRIGVQNPPLWQMVVKDLIIIAFAGFFFIKLAQHNGLPVVLIILLLVACFYHFYTERTTGGRKVYAVGGNENAAKLSGIAVKKVIFNVYLNCGMLSGLAGLILIARNASATPTAGENFELDAIASCFIGGASTSGGIGTVVGCITGAFIMGVLNNGMSLMGLSSYWQRVVKGLVLLGAVTLDLYNKKRAK
ncbi:ABC transporter permease subunit [Diplocloster agilis]|uniref:ABC transporter permease subunit n=1 Tax=Diplocloster agilis TaxID=2850323 RepID=UPI00082024F9|nr:sugar ABC transporter permease [Suonthocola fibrivorans]MCU6732331.1 sugar ABC transporter permease [Suonthocola fibrivorans]SCI43614.1 Xylose transport system permease protein xylH [uncultured Clostridium sp.]